jgi:hypothetical protein
MKVMLIVRNRESRKTSSQDILLKEVRLDNKSLVGLARSPYSIFRNTVPLAYPTRFFVH